MPRIFGCIVSNPKNGFPQGISNPSETIKNALESETTEKSKEGGERSGFMHVCTPFDLLRTPCEEGTIATRLQTWKLLSWHSPTSLWLVLSSERVRAALWRNQACRSLVCEGMCVQPKGKGKGEDKG